MDTIDEKKFRLTARRVMLTYKTHIPKDFLENEMFVGKNATKFLRAAHETSDSINQYDHTHVLIELAVKPDIKNCRHFDIELGNEMIHPHFDPIRTNAHWKHCLKYIAKQDPANADLLHKFDEPFVETVWKENTLQDALTACVTQPSDVNAVIAAWRCKVDNFDLYNGEIVFRPWQQKVMDYIDTKPGRDILWVYDEIGAAGKSWLGGFLEDRYDALMVTQFGGSYHIGTVVQTAMSRGWNGALTVIDLPRQCADKAIYEPIEMIKNGRITALKYQGTTLKWRPGHVIVFANFKPYREQWSEDRYNVVELRRNGDATAPDGAWRQLTLKELPPAPLFDAKR